MRVIVYRALSLGFLLGCLLLAIVFLANMVGCATDPATGKTTFDAAKAQAIVQSPEVQAGASALPYGLGALGTASLSLLFGYLARKQTDAHQTAQQTAKDLATHAITAVADSIQKDSGVAVVAQPPPAAAPAAPTPTAKAA